MDRSAKLEWKLYQHNIEKGSWFFVYNERKRVLHFPFFDYSAILENGKIEEKNPTFEIQNSLNF